MKSWILSIQNNNIDKVVIDTDPVCQLNENILKQRDIQISHSNIIQYLYTKV